MLLLAAISILIWSGEIKANYYAFEKAFNILVILNSIALFGLVYVYKKSLWLALLIALILPALHFGYPVLTDYIDMERAKNNPDSVYYEP